MHGEEVCRSFRGQRWTQRSGTNLEEEACSRDYDLSWKPSRAADGLGRDSLHQGHNSGYQALNLAYLLGARRIVLLGYDMQMTGARAHFFGDHPAGCYAESNYRQDFLPAFPALARDLADEGIDVVNCTPHTALTCFRRAAL